MIKLIYQLYYFRMYKQDYLNSSFYETEMHMKVLLIHNFKGKNDWISFGKKTITNLLMICMQLLYE